MRASPTAAIDATTPGAIKSLAALRPIVPVGLYAAFIPKITAKTAIESATKNPSTSRTPVSPPWTQDEKTAALAGLIVTETNGAGLTPPQ